MNVEEYFGVEVAYATPETQVIIAIEIHIGATAAEAVHHSGIESQFPEIDLEKNKLGIFGKQVKPQSVLNKGDRVEIYRPLTADPKVVRRELAAIGKTMGKGVAESKKAG